MWKEPSPCAQGDYDGGTGHPEEPPEPGSRKVSSGEEMAHLSQVPSRRCEESVHLLGQLTVFQDKFLLMTQSH